MLADLEWLGIAFDGISRQSERLDAHAAMLDRLKVMGLVYPAFMSRGDIRRHVAERPGWPRDPDGAPLYPGGERELDEAERGVRIEAGEPHTWRLDTVAALGRTGPVTWRAWKPDGSIETVQADPLAWGDPVLARRDMPTSYHLAVVTDDAAQGVTHVVRGRDLERATDLHALLQRLLERPSPLYRHHDLVMGEDGRKLSKSHGDTSLRALRSSGVEAAAITRMAGLDQAT